MTDQPAEFTAEHLGHVTVATVRGEIDLSNASWFAAELGRSAEAAPVLILDLTGVSYMDSAGIGVLLRLSRTRQRAGQDLRVVAPAGSAAAQVLRLAPIAGVPVDASREHALAAV